MAKKDPGAPSEPKRRVLAALVLEPSEEETHPLRGATLHNFYFGGNLAPGTGVQEGVLEVLFAEGGARLPAGDSGHWRNPIIFTGLASLLPAAKRFASIGDLTDIPGSTLYAAGEAVAYEIRRRILAHELESTGWNLSHVADRLRLKSASKVLEAIRAHGLEADYERAKAEGRVAGKSRKVRSTRTDE